MKLIILVALGILDVVCFVLFLYLWRTSHFAGAEIGNLDWGLAKICGIGTLIISVLMGLIYYLQK